ncbi:ATP-binding protein [bacterium]|nr:ATP-binding protein [bacterium]
MQTSEKINIRPETRILSILKHIEYDPWFALAEYVDNSIDSYLKYQKELKEIEGNDYCLQVNIEINPTDKTIEIRDNAAGIHKKDYARAFRAAEAPPDNSGLSEFGMGMKSASCWFSNLWTVRTTAIGESLEKTVSFNLEKIFNDSLDELDVTHRTVNPNSHYTVITLREIEKLPIKKTLGKIQKHLESIYRDFFRQGKLKIIFRDKLLGYKTPEILNTPYFKEPDSESIEWKKNIKFPLEDGLSIHGFIAIRKKASTAEAGLALFRRGRVIQGSFDDTFRPTLIFGRSNSYAYQRIFGELHLEGFNVSFTKRGIRWDENMDAFLDLLKDDLSHSDFPLLQQAEGHRARATKKDLQKTAESVLDSETKKYEESLPNTINEINDNAPSEISDELTPTEQRSFRELDIELNDTVWKIIIELSYDSSLENWIEVGNNFIPSTSKKPDVKQVGIRLSLSHPFSRRFAGIDKSKIEPLLRIASAFGLAEELARSSGVKKAGTIRMNFNKILTQALSNI